MEEGMTHVNLPFPDKVIPAPYAGDIYFTWNDVCIVLML